MRDSRLVHDIRQIFTLSLDNRARRVEEEMLGFLEKWIIKYYYYISLNIIKLLYIIKY